MRVTTTWSHPKGEKRKRVEEKIEKKSSKRRRIKKEKFRDFITLI